MTDPKEALHATTPGRAVHDEARRPATTATTTTNAAAEAGLNTDARGGIGSASRIETSAAPSTPAAPPPEGRCTEPRQDTRLGQPGSQGLTGAQGSGGGADRGVNEAT